MSTPHPDHPDLFSVEDIRDWLRALPLDAPVVRNVDPLAAVCPLEQYAMDRLALDVQQVSVGTVAAYAGDRDAIGNRATTYSFSDAVVQLVRELDRAIQVRWRDVTPRTMLELLGDVA